MSECLSPSIAEQYRSGADRVVHGQFPVRFDVLPAIAYEMDPSTTFDPSLRRYRQFHEEIERSFVTTDDAYRHVAWWTYDAFARDAKLDNRRREKLYETYFHPNGAGSIGFMEMARHIATVTHVYAGQREMHPMPPETPAEQVREVAAIALDSTATLERVASQNAAIAGRLERNLGLMKKDRQWVVPNFEDANHRFELIDDDGTLRVRAKRLDDQVHAIERNYLQDMERTGEEPKRAVGCFALKTAGSEDTSVFFAIWHGMVVAAAQHPELIATQLDEIQRFKEGGRLGRVISPVQ